MLLVTKRNIWNITVSRTITGKNSYVVSELFFILTLMFIFFMTPLWNDGACISVSDILNSGSRSRSLSNGLKLKSLTSRGEAGTGDVEALGGAGTTDVEGMAAGCSTSAMLAIAEQLATGAGPIAPDEAMAAGSGYWRIDCAGWMGGGRPANKAVR